MTRFATFSALALLTPLFLACGSSGSAGGAAPSATPDVAGDLLDASVEAAGDAAPLPPNDAGTGDSKPGVDKSAMCASTFGTALTSAFGRLDGTVLAVVPPKHPTCTAPNATHVVIQVTMNGAPYRMVVAVLSNRAPPDVLFHEIDAPLAAGAWAEGWHPGVSLDYVTTLSVHSSSFTPVPESQLVAKIASEIEIGARISVFSTSAGSVNSAHLVHRNATNADGAIVLRPDSATPHYLLISFADQTF